MGIFNFLKKSRPQSRPKSGQKSGKIAKRKPKAVKKEIVSKVEPIKKAPARRKESVEANLLKEPHISEKATDLSESGKYIFKIYKNANKSEIKKAIANLYGVAVKNVNIINIKTKERLLRGKKGKKHGYKKAIITLEKGHKIEILPH